MDEFDRVVWWADHRSQVSEVMKQAFETRAVLLSLIAAIKSEDVGWIERALDEARAQTAILTMVLLFEDNQEGNSTWAI